MFAPYVYCKVGFFEVVTPLGGAQVFICRVGIGFWLPRLCFLAISFPVMFGFLPKSESKWGLSRANFLPKSESKWGLSRANTTAARQKGGDNFKKSDFIVFEKFVGPESTRHLFVCVNDVPDARILQRIDEICDFISSILESDGTGRWQKPTESSKQSIRTLYLGHLTGYQPIRELECRGSNTVNLVETAAKTLVPSVLASDFDNFVPL
eukprot:sb/3470293/